MKQSESLEIWGGVETTCNRVRDKYFDQMVCSGHHARMDDLELFASLGFRTLRTGLLWERHELDPSWKWADSWLGKMRELRIRPIAGLVHHGSGPEHTSLLDPDFPEKLAAYAETVAKRFSWVDAYTPVNEPHTTARFSGLYGIWYPHHMSRKNYLIALLHQIKATVLCMRAIRRVNAGAQLIQTEDVGRIWTTDELRSIGEILNQRRWLGFDLLQGTVDRHHPLFQYMRASGISEDQILWFQDNPCPPNMIGINYYVTSDRFLDHRTERYPSQCGSAEGPFADLEAVRIWPEGIAGFDSMLSEAWHRYRVPVAITEVHLGDDPHEQIRWLAEAWESAQRVRGAGVNCRAITIWALLGSYYWDVLVTQKNDHYEPGVFDVSNGFPAATELAEVVAGMLKGNAPTHPALLDPGWWRRADRIIHDLAAADDSCEVGKLISA